VGGEACFYQELKDSVHLDKLNQVNFVFEQLVTPVEVVEPFPGLLVPRLLLEAATEEEDEFSFDVLTKAVAVGLAVLDGLAHFVLVVVLRLVPAIFLVFRVHARHKVAFKTERLEPADHQADQSPNQANVATNVGEDCVERHHRPLLFDLFAVLDEPHRYDCVSVCHNRITLNVLDSFEGHVVEGVLEATTDEGDARKIEQS